MIQCGHERSPMKGPGNVMYIRAVSGDFFALQSRHEGIAAGLSALVWPFY